MTDTTTVTGSAAGGTAGDGGGIGHCSSFHESEKADEGRQYARQQRRQLVDDELRPTGRDARRRGAVDAGRLGVGPEYARCRMRILRVERPSGGGIALD